MKKRIARIITVFIDKRFKMSPNKEDAWQIEEILFRKTSYEMLYMR